MVSVTLVGVKLNGHMRGMTIVDDRLYIVTSQDSLVHVYDSHSLAAVTSVAIPHLKNAQGIASCSERKVLYVSDGWFSCIHRVNLTDNKVNRWRLNESYMPWGLSVTVGGHLLVTVWIKSTEGESLILEYSNECHLLREIKLEKSIQWAWQTVQLSSKQFVISHGGLFAFFLHRICLINSRGKIIKSYGREGGSLLGQLNLPRSITIDNTADLLFVADSYNKRILMFSGNLDFQGSVDPRDETKNSSYVYYDQNEKRLFVDSIPDRILGITGLTVLDDKIFTLFESASFIKVFDLDSFTAQPHINVPDLKDPQGLVCCSHNKTLYISDGKSECIRRLDIIENIVKHWKLRENYRPWGLSVTAEHNLVVAVWIRFTKGISRVLEFTSEGQLIREIKLDRSIEWAWQTIQLSSDQFVICHGVFSPLHRLCVINSAGQIIKSYGEEGGRSEGQLYVPCSITLDSSRGQVFLADRYNNRVLMFNGDLELSGIVRTPRDLFGPKRLYVDVNFDKLFVGDSTDSVLIISSPEEWIKKT